MKLSLNLSFLISVGLLSVASVVSGEATDEANRQLSTKKRLSMKYASTMQLSASASACGFNFGEYCRDYAHTAAIANGWAVNAESEAEIWLCAESICTAFESVYATACAFTVAAGAVEVEAISSGSQSSACLAVVLDSAVSTIALARSAADATAFAAVDAFSFTDVNAYCQKVGKKQPYLCGGLAESGLFTIGAAAAGATAQAGALAKSAAGSSIDARVWASGASLSTVKGLIEATASSWAFADASATTHALAEAFASTCVASFSKVCVDTHAKVCSDPNHFARSICGQPASVSCAKAWTIGEGMAGACADSCASGCADVIVSSTIHAAVTANVACSTPSTTALLEACTPASTWVSCRG